MTQEFSLPWGVDIMAASMEAIRLAQKNDEDHYFNFNGVKVTVSADSKVLHIVGLYYLASEGDEVGPYYEKEEEPKLYDYYFVAYERHPNPNRHSKVDPEKGSRFICVPAGSHPTTAFDEAVLKASRNDDKILITAFSFIKTAP